MRTRSLVSAGLLLGWCAVLLNGCGDDITADDDAMGGGGSTNGGSKARGGMGGMGGNNVGGNSVGGNNVGGSSGGNPAGGTTFEPGGAGGESGAAEAGSGGMAPLGQAGSSGDAGGGMAGESGGPGAAGGGGDWSTAGEGGADDGMAGAAGSGTGPARTCMNGCAELFYPATTGAAGREWDLPLGAATDMSSSVISVRLRLVEGSAGVIRIYAKSPPLWGSTYSWSPLSELQVGTWVTLMLDLTAPRDNLVRTEVQHIGLRYEVQGAADAVRFDVDSITISNATVGPWDFMTSEAPLGMGWTATPEPGTIGWIMPEN